MKTLDEVIELMEAQVGELTGVTGVVLYADDILYYLKKYQGYLIGKEISEAFDEAFTEMYNPPLTWDELKQMRGKPVWIEDKCLASDWYLLMKHDAFEPEEVKQKLFGLDKVGFCLELRKETYGSQWLAYRKERK